MIFGLETKKFSILATKTPFRKVEFVYISANFETMKMYLCKLFIY